MNQGGEQRYDVIFLDSDETIVDFDNCQRRAFQWACARQLPGCNVADLYRCYVEVNAAAWRRHNLGEITKDELRELRMRETLRDCHVDAWTFAACYEDRLAEEVHFMPNAVATLERLRSACTLVVVTNGLGHVHRRRFAKAGIDHLFSGVVVSSDKSEPNFRKPFADIFRDAHDRFAAGVPKHRILMVGDSEGTDVAGGAAYGIDTCRYQARANGDGSASRATHTMTDWQELPAIVGI